MTDEDCDIWLLRLRGPDGYPRWINKVLESDRRDADLIYLARLWRGGEMRMDHTYAHSGPCGRFAIDGIRRGGHITNCA